MKPFRGGAGADLPDVEIRIATVICAQIRRTGGGSLHAADCCSNVGVITNVRVAAERTGFPIRSPIVDVATAETT